MYAPEEDRFTTVLPFLLILCPSTDWVMDVPSIRQSFSFPPIPSALVWAVAVFLPET